MKKKYIGGVILIVCVALTWCFYGKNPAPKEEKSPKIIVAKPVRPIPATADFGAYLAGTVAKYDKNYPLATQYYKKVLEKDKENYEIRADIYALTTLTDEMDTLMLVANDLQAHQSDMPLLKYAKVADFIKKGDYTAIIPYLTENKDKNGSKLLDSLLTAWTYAALDNKDLALTSLDEMKDFSPTMYMYHKALIADYFKDVALAQESYNFFMDKSFPCAQFFVSVKDFFTRHDFWNDNNPLFNKYDVLVKADPFLGDIFNQITFTPVATPKQGFNLAFQTLSQYFHQQKAMDLALCASNLGLYIERENQSIIWRAELLESLDLRDFANKEYDSLSENADIIRFKKVINYIALKQYKQAYDNLLVLEENNKSNALILSLLGQMAFQLNKYLATITYFDRALERLNPIQHAKNMSDILYQQAQSYFRLDKHEKMEESLQKAIALNPENTQALNYLGYEWLDNNKNIAQAFEYIQKAHQLSPDSYEIIDSMAKAYYVIGEYEKALEYGEKAVDMFGASAVINMNLGDIYRALGREREAISQYKKSLSLQIDLNPQLANKINQKLAQ